jgi:hypothetical protein
MSSCGCSDSCSCSTKSDNYMFFQNLKTIHHAVGELLKMDEAQLDKLLSSGHDWANDHMTTSADDVEEVYHFVTSNLEHEDSTDSYNMQKSQFIPAGFKNHLKQAMHEAIRKIEGGYAVYPSKGGKRLGTHKTRKSALKQLAAVEIAKHTK